MDFIIFDLIQQAVVNHTPGKMTRAWLMLQGYINMKKKDMI